MEDVYEAGYDDILSLRGPIQRHSFLAVHEIGDSKLQIKSVSKPIPDLLRKRTKKND